MHTRIFFVLFFLFLSSQSKLQAAEYTDYFDGTPQPILLDSLPDLSNLNLLENSREFTSLHRERLIKELEVARRIAPEYFKLFVQAVPSTILYNNDLELCVRNLGLCGRVPSSEELERTIEDILTLPIDECELLRQDVIKTGGIYEKNPNMYTEAEYLHALKLFFEARCSLGVYDGHGTLAFNYIGGEPHLRDEMDAMINQAPSVFVLLLTMFHDEESSDYVSSNYLANLKVEPSSYNIRRYLDELNTLPPELSQCMRSNLLHCKASEAAEKLRLSLSCKIWGQDILGKIIRCERDGKQCKARDKSAVSWNRSKCASK